MFLPLRFETHPFLFWRNIMKFERNMSFSAEEFSDGEVLLYIRKKRLRIQFMRNLREHKHLTIRKTKKGADLTKSIVKSAPKIL